MKDKQDYIRDLTEIRYMMERSSKFLLLSGWAGIMAGIFALSGAYVAHTYFHFNPDEIFEGSLVTNGLSENIQKVILLAIAILIASMGTATYFSYKKAVTRGEKLWNATSKQLLISMGVPFIAGGLLILSLLSNGLVGLIAPFSLLFYGLALYNGSKYTYDAVKFLEFTEIALGLLSSYFIAYGLLFWALGFGVVHIVYGIYVYYRYEK